MSSRRFQFRLRTLFIVTMLAAIGCPPARRGFEKWQAAERDQRITNEINAMNLDGSAMKRYKEPYPAAPAEVNSEDKVRDHSTPIRGT